MAVPSSVASSTARALAGSHSLCFSTLVSTVSFCGMASSQTPSQEKKAGTTTITTTTSRTTKIEYALQPLAATDIPPQTQRSTYPDPFASRMQGRIKRKLGNHFGLMNFGVNLTTLAPGAMSALKHSHSKQDEFVYVVQGQIALRYGDEEYDMGPEDCIGFPCSSNSSSSGGGGVAAHQLINRSATDVAVYLEVGDRAPGDNVTYPDDDFAAVGSEDGASYRFVHKDGRPYDDEDSTTNKEK